eukprot:3258239-Amphidinium_carterae.1
MSVATVYARSTRSATNTKCVPDVFHGESSWFGKFCMQNTWPYGHLYISACNTTQGAPTCLGPTKTSEHPYAHGCLPVPSNLTLILRNRTNR